MPTIPAALIACLTQSRTADNRVIGRWMLPVSLLWPQISAEDKRLMASLRPLFTQALREKDSCLDEILLEMLRHASRASEPSFKLETLMAPLCADRYRLLQHKLRHLLSIVFEVTMNPDGERRVVFPEHFWMALETTSTTVIHRDDFLNWLWGEVELVVHRIPSGHENNAQLIVEWRWAPTA
jgi:hypothetical protein